jgi:hypothetical protein
MSEAILENRDIKEWIDKFKNKHTTKLYSFMIQRFFTWYIENHQKTVEDFVNLRVKKTKNKQQSNLQQLVMAYHNDLLKKGESANTIRAAITCVKSFAAYLDKPLNLQGKIVKVKPDVDSHVFRIDDLTRMFQVGNTKEKAILSTMCSLGWEREDVLALKREFIEKHLAIAKAKDQRFIFFDVKRKKIKALKFGVLNPLAVEWLEKWLQTTESKKSDKLFNMTGDGLNKLIRRLVRESSISTTGRIHSHLITNWVMNQLSKSRFNESERKFAVGKAISLHDSTYLTNIKNAIIKKYPRVYNEFLNIEAKGKDFQQLKAEIDRLKGLLKDTLNLPNSNQKELKQ